MAMRERTTKTYVRDENDDVRISVDFDSSGLDSEKAEKIRQVIEDALNDVADVLVICTK